VEKRAALAVNQCCAAKIGLSCEKVRLAHDPEKWQPVFGKDHAQAKCQVGGAIQPKRIAL
jgi:hypothetical protein